MRISWRTEWPFWLLLACMFALAAAIWGAAPDRIPVHWGFGGHADRWGGKFEGLLLLPIVGLGLYVLLLLIPRIDPGRANYESFASAYLTLRLLVLIVTAAFQVITVLAALGRHVDMAAAVPLVVGGLLVVIGNLLGKVRPNWFVGIRTPWTLSSKESWARTHHAGGWLFIVFGLLLMAFALIRSAWFLAVVGAVIAGGLLGLVAYSYVVWKNDPDKVPPAGTTPANS